MILKKCIARGGGHYPECGRPQEGGANRWTCADMGEAEVKNLEKNCGRPLWMAPKSVGEVEIELSILTNRKFRIWFHYKRRFDISYKLVKNRKTPIARFLFECILVCTISLSFVCLSIFQSVCLLVCLSLLSVRLSVFQSVCLPVCLFFNLSVRLSNFQSVCLPVYLSVCLSVNLSICLCVCLSVSVCVCRSICLPVCI